MAAAFRAVDLDARHAVTPIDVRGNRVSDRGPEAGPAGAALELRVGSEERLPAGGAVEGAGPLLVVERTRPRPLGAVLAQHVELFRRQRLLPFFFGFHRPRSLSTRYIFFASSHLLRHLWRIVADLLSRPPLRLHVLLAIIPT